jgi:putative transcriptional regulator
MLPITKGKILIAEPFLLDNFFSRSVILLCEHKNEEGSVGFMINRMLSDKLNDFFPELNTCSIPIYYGGPVNPDRLHFLHTLDSLIPDGLEIEKGIFWGGDFKLVKTLIAENKIPLHQIKFFLGYSGWEKGQLVKELEDESWIVSKTNKKIIFEEPETDIWKKSLLEMGGNYAQMSNYPIHPSLN